MPYLLLVFGILIGIFALYRFFLKADVEQIKALILAAFTITVCGALFLLSVTGRLPAAIAIVSALAPFAVGYLTKLHQKKTAFDRQVDGTPKPMTRDEALDVLGLQKGADETAIKDAYKKLMKKVHPDQEGSEWMAAKLNEAKDLLLKKK